MSTAVVIHVPHASTVVPADVRDQFAVDDAGLERELLLMTDHFVDQLFALPADEAVTVRHEVSRLVLDPERFEDDADETMARVGMGAVYSATHTGEPSGSPLRRLLEPTEREALLARYYRPHHGRLERAVGDALRLHGRCLVVDAHSYPARPLPYEKPVWPAEDPGWKHRPAICLGADAPGSLPGGGSHTPVWLQAAAYDAFAARFASVCFNRPFSGTLVPLRYYGHDARVASIMVEVRRDQYLDEESGEKLAGFDEVGESVRAAVRDMAAAAAGLR
jgi:N-formylglutamate deformylase